jgi:hypothetical protein
MWMQRNKILLLSKADIEVLTEKHKEAPHAFVTKKKTLRNYRDGIS